MADEEFNVEDQPLSFTCPYCSEAVSFPEIDRGSMQGCPFCPETFLVPLKPGEPGRPLPFPMETPRLVLRLFRPGDRSDLFEISNDDEAVSDLLRDGERVRLTDNEGRVCLGIELKDGQKIIGHASLYCRLGASGVWRIDHRRSDIAVYIPSQYRPEEFGSEAVRALLLFGFVGLHLPRITTFCDSNNMANRQMFQKAGLRQEGEFIKDQPLSDGTRASTVWFAMLAEEFSGGAEEQAVGAPDPAAT